MKWIDLLLNVDTEMALYAKKNGQAKLEVYYYGERDGVVRKKLIVSPQKVKTFYEKEEVIED